MKFILKSFNFGDIFFKISEKWTFRYEASQSELKISQSSSPDLFISLSLNNFIDKLQPNKKREK